MGNLQDRAKKEAIFDVKKIYWDVDGNLRHGTSDRSRDDEIISIVQADTCDDSNPERLWMIVPSRWIRKWLLFAHYKVCDSPGKIDMFSLLQEDHSVEGHWRPKNTIKPPRASNNPEEEDTPGHYRRVTLSVWLKLIDLYDVLGYAIAVKGTPVDDISRWRVFKNPRIIDLDKLPPPIIPAADKTDNKDNEKSKSKV